jgi:hypothetical protein
MARPVRFRDYLPEAFRDDAASPNFQDRFLRTFEELFEELEGVIEGASPDDLSLHLVDSDLLGTAKIRVQADKASTGSFPKGSRMTHANSMTTLREDLPVNPDGPASYLVEIENAEFALELSSGDRLQVTHDNQSCSLIFLGIEGLWINVQAPNAKTPNLADNFPRGTFVTVSNAPKSSNPGSTTLSADYATKGPAATSLALRDAEFARFVLQAPESILVLHAGGVPDLFHPDLTPPPQFSRREGMAGYQPEPESAFLKFLASWIGLPLRDDLILRPGETDPDGLPIPDDPAYAERKMRWNRDFLRTAMSIYPRRGTLTGVEEMLRAWLKDDLVEDGIIVSDLLRTHTDVDSIFQLAPPDDSTKTFAQVGINTVLGEGPPFFFLVDLTADPTVPGLRNPRGIDVLLREARFILESETPAHTYYQLRVRASTMQLAPLPGDERPGEIYAQVGQTTQLWDEPSVWPDTGGR